MSTKLDELSREQLDLRIELGDQQKKLREQKEKLEEADAQLRSEMGLKRFWRNLSGLSGLVIIFSNLAFILFGVVPANYATVGYFLISFIVGAILLFIAIAYEKVKVSLSASTPTK